MDTSSIPRVIFKYIINEKKRRANKKCDLTTVGLKSLVAGEIFSLKYRLYTILLTTTKKNPFVLLHGAQRRHNRKASLWMGFGTYPQIIMLRLINAGVVMGHHFTEVYFPNKINKILRTP